MADLYNGVDVSQIIPSLSDRISQLEATLTAIGYDAKAAKKRRFPTKKQETVLNSITRAMCVETIDPWKENRVRFYHPLLHDPDTKLLSLPFAQPVSSMGGFDDCGLNWVPPAGSTLMLFFEGGSRDSPFYIGTTWHRDRGPNGSQVNDVFPSREWQSLYQNDERGQNYLHGPDDGSQCLPPWNTESYNAGDITQIQQFSEDPLEQKRITYPNIYGFKTPEKHMLKMVDGNAKCNRKWKRLELMSGDGGGWMIFKDDHLHYGGQWSHPSCNPKPGGGPTDQPCAEYQADLPFYSDIQGKPLEKSDCNGNVQNANILYGHTPTPCDPKTKYCDSQVGTNRFFKQKNECRPYSGPGTPQNNRCDLPQSGIQFLTMSGHTWVGDDSVEEPRGSPGWKKSLGNFDFGCNDKFLGRTYWKEATGHEIMMSGIEDDTALRGENNFIRIKSASGNSIELNDHTVGEPDRDCPPNFAGEKRGISMKTTSNHVFKMIDHMNLQCSPKRQSGGEPVSKATKAYIQIKSGYGLGMQLQDESSQETTQSQWLQLINPQCASSAPSSTNSTNAQNNQTNTDSQCNSCPEPDCRGPHFLRMQASPKGQAGIVFLRAGGHSIRETYDTDVVIVGDKTNNPSDKYTYVSKKQISITEDIEFRYSGELHVLFAEKEILLMAGRDCEPQIGKKCWGPCLYSVIIARCPQFCPLTGILHWTERAMSERVFASGWNSKSCPAVEGKTGKCEEIVYTEGTKLPADTSAIGY